MREVGILRSFRRETKQNIADTRMENSAAISYRKFKQKNQQTVDNQNEYVEDQKYLPSFPSLSVRPCKW